MLNQNLLEEKADYSLDPFEMTFSPLFSSVVLGCVDCLTTSSTCG